MQVVALFYYMFSYFPGVRLRRSPRRNASLLLQSLDDSRSGPRVVCAPPHPLQGTAGIKLVAMSAGRVFRPVMASCGRCLAGNIAAEVDALLPA